MQRNQEEFMSGITMLNTTRRLGILFSISLLISGSLNAAEKLVVERSATINASCSDVWKFAGGFGTIDNILNKITNIEMDGDAVGAIRVLTLDDGVVIKERLETLESNSYSYVITDHPLPVSEYRATISVAVSTEGKCDLNWKGELVAKGVSDAEAMGIFEGIYENGIAEINKKFP